MRSSVWGRQYRAHPLDQQAGPKFTPPEPVIFTDRVTGTRYLLSHDSAADVPTLVSVPASMETRRSREPILPTVFGTIRVYVREAALSYEGYQGVRDSGIGRETTVEGPLLTLNPDEPRVTYEMYAGSGTALGDALCLRKYESLGQTLEVSELGCNFFLRVGEEVFDESVFEPGVFV